MFYKKNLSLIIFLLMTLLASSVFAQGEDGLRFFWWNIHAGSAKEGDSNLTFNKNLSTLIHAKAAPDVMAFALYTDGAINPDTLEEVDRLYPYSSVYFYTGEEGQALALYSRYPMTITHVDILQPLLLKARSDGEREAYLREWCGEDHFCNRPLVISKIHGPKRDVTLAATHIFDFWRKYKEIFGVVNTTQEVLYGESNPIWFQLNDFRKFLEMDLGADLKNPDTVILGDFNIPRQILGLHTRGYRKISEGLVDSVKGTPITFPTDDSADAKHFPGLEIDHAFVTPGTKILSSKVLPLKGSDHYPIYLSISH